MEQEVLDLSYLHTLSGNDPVYICDVINLFLDIVPDGLTNLENLVDSAGDFETIHRQSHFLKSSAAIIKIRDMYDDLARISTLSREKRGMDEIKEKMDNIKLNFSQALPLILAEKEKNAR